MESEKNDYSALLFNKKDRIKDFIREAILPTVCGIFGSFIGMAIAKLLGIL